jgi:hypothetical protein
MGARQASVLTTVATNGTYWRKRCLIRCMRETMLVITCLMLAWSCSADGDRYPPLPLPPREETLSVDTVVGCYELLAFQWAPETPAIVRSRFVWPRFFVLQSSEAVGSPWFQHPMISREAQLFRGSWRLTADTQLTLVWSSGFRAITVVAHRPSWEPVFVGIASTWEDLGGVQHTRARVVIEPTLCWEGADLIGIY